LLLYLTQNLEMFFATVKSEDFMLDYSCYYPTFKVTKSTCPLSLRYFVCYRHDSVGTRL